MKKILSLFLLVLSLCLLSCGKESIDVDKIPEKIIEKVNNLESYKTNTTMQILRDAKLVSFDIEATYLAPSYYKVSFINSSNNNKQIIVKNKDGVFSLTPALGKEFKFESEWPLNSSHAYLLCSIVNDIKNDPDMVVKTVVDDVIIKSKISHKINSDLSYQEVMIDKKTCEIKKVTYYNTLDQGVIICTFNSIVTNLSLTSDDFNIEKIMNDSVNTMGEGSVSVVDKMFTVGYVLDGYTLSSSSVTDVSIYNYSGESTYKVICRNVVPNDIYTVSRIYNDFTVGYEGLIYISDNGVALHYLDKEIMVMSDTLEDKQMIDIINSCFFE